MSQENEALKTLKEQAFKEKVSHLAKKHNVATEQVLGLFEEELELAKEHWEIFFPKLPNQLDEQKILVDHFLFRVVNARLVAEKAEEEAALDHLTQIPNRRALDLALEKYVANFQRSKQGKTNQPFCLILFDLDNFKSINDTHGHTKGDEVLKTVAEVAKVGIRPTDFVARYGGEEFAIIFSGKLTEATKLAERVRLAISEIEIAKIGKITASFGLSEFKNSLDELTKDADTALYKAKGWGKNRVVNCINLQEPQI